MNFNYIYNFKFEEDFRTVNSALDLRVLDANISFFDLATKRWEQFRDSLRFYQKNLTTEITGTNENVLDILANLKYHEGAINNQSSDVVINFTVPNSREIALAPGDKVYYSNNNYAFNDYRRYTVIPSLTQQGYDFTHKNGVVSYNLDNLVPQKFEKVNFKGRSGGARWYYDPNTISNTILPNGSTASILDITTIVGKVLASSQISNITHTFMDTFQISVLDKITLQEIGLDYKYEIKKYVNENKYELVITFSNVATAQYVKNNGRIVIY
jgi:hypothetical protein